MKSANKKVQIENSVKIATDLFTKSNIVYKYTSKQAEADGILFDLAKINPDWERGMFKYITTNLLNRGYIKDDEINQDNLVDLLNQCLAIVKKSSDNFQRYDWFYSGVIELPSGKKQKVFIAQNETGKYTIMLPSDY